MSNSKLNQAVHERIVELANNLAPAGLYRGLLVRIRRRPRAA